MRSLRVAQRGLSLIELMVGILIGLLATLVVFQIFSVSERQKRTITGASDAQTNGAAAILAVERDTRMAGWGQEQDGIGACDVTYSYSTITNAPIPNLFANVLITDGGAGSDRIDIKFYGDPADQTFNFSSTTLRSTMPQSSAELNVSSVFGCQEGNLVVVRQAGSCTLMEVTQVQGAALKLQHNPGGTQTHNPTINYQKDNGWPAYTTGAVLQCMAAITTRSYQVSAQRELEYVVAQTNTAPVTTPVVPNIVNMQLQYGVSDAGAQNVNQWVDATGAWANPSTADQRRIKAVRVAVVARSAEYEKPEPGQACSATTAAQVADWSDWATFNTAGFPADWACYRYKVFETVVPLRNIIWANL